MTYIDTIDYLPSYRVSKVCSSDTCHSVGVTLYPSLKKVYKRSTSSPYPFVKHNPFTGIKLYRDRGVHELFFQQYGDFGVSHLFAEGTISFDENKLSYFLSTSDDPSVQLAVAAFYSRISNLKVNMAQVYAERQKTIDLVAKSCKQLAVWYRSLRRGRNPFTGETCNGRNASNLWLQYAYGWTPLVSDVYSAMDALKGVEPKLKLSLSRRANGAELEVKQSGYGYVQGHRVLNEVHVSSRSSCRTTVSGLFEIKDPSLLTANYVGLTNPALLVWELLPYSFVVDWFLPIGAWLESLNALAGLSVREASITRTNVINWSGMSKLALTGSYQSKATSVCDINQVSKCKKRELGLPSLPLPTFRSPVSTSHALTGLALLRQAFK